MQLQVVGFGTRAVPMLVDTGSPNCYIADIALQNFECPTPYPDEHANIEIARKRFRAVVIKPGAVENERLLGLNILGMNAINAICGAGPSSSFQEAFVEAFNGNGQLPVAKVPRLTGPAAPAAPAAPACCMRWRIAGRSWESRASHPSCTGRHEAGSSSPTNLRSIPK